LSCEEIAGEIERSLDFLESAMRDVPERQRSLRVVFEHSWGRLSAKEQDVFARLSIFRGGCTRQAATAVTGATPAVLASLTDKSMLKRDESGRYELHKVIRQYGEAKLAERVDIHTQTRLKHCTWYLDAVAAKTEALQVRSQREALQELRAESGNIQLAWRFGVEAGAYNILSRALDGYGRLCVLAGRYIEILDACQLLVKFLRAEAKSDDASLEARCLIASANILNALTSGDSALATVQEAIELLHTRGITAALPKALTVAATAARDAGQRDLAKSFVREAMQLFSNDDLASIHDRISIYGIASHIAYDDGDYEATQTYARQSVRLAESIGDLYGSTRAMSALANVANYQGDYKAARIHLERTIAILESLENTYQVALARYNLGLTEFFLQHYEAAQSHFTYFERIAQDYGNVNGLGLAANGLAMLNIALGEFDEAVLRCEQAIERCQTAHERYAAIYLHQTLGEALIELRRTQDAETVLRAGLTMALDTQLVPGALHVLLGWSRLLPGERALPVLDFILNHPGVIRFTSDRALALWQEYTAKLTTEDIAAIRAHNAGRTLDDMAGLVLLDEGHGIHGAP